MSRAVKLIGFVVVASAMTAALIAAGAASHMSPRPAATTVDHPNHATRVVALEHCRATTGPDAACEAAWSAERRRFFGKANQ